MRSFFDTNLLVYLFDADAPEKRERIETLLADEVSAGRAVLSTQVLQEFYVSVTRKLARPLTEEVAEEIVRDLARLPVTQVDSRMVLTAIGRSREARISFWDALIVEAALVSGASRLLTEDLQDGMEIGGLRIENPFGGVDL